MNEKLKTEQKNELSNALLLTNKVHILFCFTALADCNPSTADFKFNETWQRKQQ